MRRFKPKPSSSLQNPNPTKTSASRRLSEILLVSAVTKTLSESGPNALDLEAIPLTPSLLHQVLSSVSLHPLKKLDFFDHARPSFGHFVKHLPSAFSLALRVACRANYLDRVPHLICSMKEDGVVVDSSTFKVVLDACIRGGKFEYALEIIDYVEALGVMTDGQMYGAVIIALIKKNKLGLALSIFDKLLEQGDGSGDASLPSRMVACNHILVALRKARMKDEFRDVYNRLRKKEGFEFDTWGYNICIHGFGCWGDLPLCLRLFDEMKMKSLGTGSFGPDLCTYNSLIHAMCSAGKVKDALIVFEEMKGSGHDPDGFSYRILIQGCSKSYLIEEAIRIYHEMQYNGFPPDVIVYNSLLDGLFKARRVVDACDVFEKMVLDGVRASCWTYNIIIDGLFRNGRAEGAYTLFCDLKKKGNFVDGITYSIVVLQLCKEGQLQEALSLVQEMEARGFTVDLVTITSLLIGFYKHGWWDGADTLMKHLRDINLVPAVLKWKSKLESSMNMPQSKSKDGTRMFESEGNISELVELMCSAPAETEDFSGGDSDEWSSSPHMDRLASKAQSNSYASPLFSLSRGLRVQERGEDSFDIDMVNTFLSLFLAKGKLSLACKLFEIFRNTVIDPMSYSYNSIMSSFVKKGYFDVAWGILNEMGENVCPADIGTYNVIIQGLGKIGRADLADTVLDRLMKQGGYLDVVMYNTLINVLGKAGRVGEACELFEQMTKAGISPDVVTFNTLIEVHSKAGRLKDAYKFLKMMLDSGCSPNHVTDTILDFLGKEMEKTRYKKASIMRDADVDDNPD